MLWLTDATGNIRRAHEVIRVEGTTPKVVIQVPFVVNTNEDAGATAVVSLPLGSAPLYATTTITVRNPELGHVTLVELVDEEADLVASDWIIPGVKETLEFNARNTVLSVAMTAPAMWNWPHESKFDVYNYFDQHPRFQQAVDELKAAKRWELEGEDERLRIIAEIALDAARAYAIAKGWVDPKKEEILVPNP